MLNSGNPGWLTQPYLLALASAPPVAGARSAAGAEAVALSELVARLAAVFEAECPPTEAPGMGFVEWLASHLPSTEHQYLERGARLWQILDRE